MNNKSTLAPIVIFVYKRAKHTRRLLESLAECKQIEESSVYVFSDGPKKSTDYDAVNEVRSLIHEDRWKQCFGSYTVYEADGNRGLAVSIISGVTDIINQYGRILVLEDDLIVDKSYVSYMNSALDAFKEDDRVFSVAGWTYPVNGLSKYSKDAWMFYRACSWGWGTWKDRWDSVEFDPLKADFEGKLANSKWCDEFKRGGNDLPGMLRLQLDGKIDSWAIRWNVASTDMDMLTVYPKYPVIINDGQDGSGTNCGVSDYKQLAFDNKLREYDFSNIDIDKRLVKQAWLFESDTFMKKVKRNAKVIFVERKVPNVVKKLIGKK